MAQVTVTLGEVSAPVRYAVKVVKERSIWTTSKRYSELDALRSTLKGQGLALPEEAYPPKNFSWFVAIGICPKMTQEELEARAKGLEMYWAAVAAIPETWESAAAAEFFTPGEPTAFVPPSPRPAARPAAAATADATPLLASRSPLSRLASLKSSWASSPLGGGGVGGSPTAAASPVEASEGATTMTGAIAGGKGGEEEAMAAPQVPVPVGNVAAKRRMFETSKLITNVKNAFKKSPTEAAPVASTTHANT